MQQRMILQKRHYELITTALLVASEGQVFIDKDGYLRKFMSIIKHGNTRFSEEKFLKFFK